MRLDIGGVGQSAMSQVPYGDWQDLSALLTFLGIAKCFLLGFSFGGVIALDFTLAYPERVAALVLVGTAVNGASLDPMLTEEEILAFRQQRQAYSKAKNRPAIPAPGAGPPYHP